jgi:hypothetical protein
MSSPWDVLTPTIGGILAALLGGVLGGWLAHRSQSVQRERSLRMNAYAEFIRSYASVYSQLVLPWTESGRARIDWSDWNRTLAIVNMIAHEPVAAQAVRIDEAMWRLSLASWRAPANGEEWRRLREPLDDAVLGFVNLARAELGGLGPTLSRLTGRPDYRDPVWAPVSAEHEEQH